MATLPIPNDAALAHSQALLDLLHQQITHAGGYVSFARFMELALYAPGLGYYSAGSHKLGKQGDFITAPEISPLFGRCIAKQCQQIFTTIDGGSILEIGAGTGKLASDLLQALQRQNALPAQYLILEISADLRAKQQEHLQLTCPDLLSRIRWLDTLPAGDFEGVILANEVMDALPVHLFEIEKEELKERCVTFHKNQLAWQLTPPTTQALQAEVTAIEAHGQLADGYVSEINLMLRPWIKSIGDSLKKGIILLFDYGYGRPEYYHPERRSGTLMCYYQHHRHADPFALVGLQDITAHVDFTQVAESAMDADLTLFGYTTQAAFLLACGITELLTEDLDAVEQYRQGQAIKLLTLPSQMGEAIKVMALGKAVDTPLLGFQLYDRRKDL